MTETRYPPVKRFRELTRQEQQERMELSADLLPVLQFWRGDPRLNHWAQVHGWLVFGQIFERSTNIWCD